MTREPDVLESTTANKCKHYEKLVTTTTLECYTASKATKLQLLIHLLQSQAGAGITNTTDRVLSALLRPKGQL